MSLFGFELKKILFNRRTLIILAVMSAIYAFMGFGSSYFSMGSKENYNTYSTMAEENEGLLDEEQVVRSTEAYDAAKAEYGNNSEIISHMANTDPELKFSVDYLDYATSVSEYYDGSSTDPVDSPSGINTLQERLDTMETAGESGTFAYTEISQQLEIEKEAGEPVFANTTLWDTLFANWGGGATIIMLFMPLAFILAPIFSIEASTGMDNLVLSSKHGRKKIVTAKLAAAAATSGITIGCYLAATFLSNFLSLGSFAGATAALRSVASFVQAPLNMAVWQFALIAVLWLAVMSVVYGMVMAFISSKTKNPMAAFGIGIAILLGNLALSALGTTITAMIQPLIDFGFVNLFSVTTMFESFNVFNILGMSIPYYVVAIGFVALLSGACIFGIYYSQKRRTVA